MQPGESNNRDPFARAVLTMDAALEKQKKAKSRVLPEEKVVLRDSIIQEDDPKLIKRLNHLERNPDAELKELERGYFQKARIFTDETRVRICTWLIDNFNSDYAFEFGCNEDLVQGNFRDFLVKLITQDDSTYRDSSLGEGLGGNEEIITNDNLAGLITCAQQFSSSRFAVAFGNNGELHSRINIYLAAKQASEGDPNQSLDQLIEGLIDWAQGNERNRFAQAVLEVVKNNELALRRGTASLIAEDRDVTYKYSALKRSTTKGNMSLKEIVRKIDKLEAFTS